MPPTEAALFLLLRMKLGLFGLQILNQPCDAFPRNTVHHWIDNPSAVLDLRVEFVALPLQRIDGT